MMAFSVPSCCFWCCCCCCPQAPDAVVTGWFCWCCFCWSCCCMLGGCCVAADDGTKPAGSPPSMAGACGATPEPAGQILSHQCPSRFSSWIQCFASMYLKTGFWLSRPIPVAPRTQCFDIQPFWIQTHFWSCALFSSSSSKASCNLSRQITAFSSVVPVTGGGMTSGTFV